MRTIPGSATPLSGYHFVCPCGWTTHSREPEVVTLAARKHVREHRLKIQRTLRKAPR